MSQRAPVVNTVLFHSYIPVAPVINVIGSYFPKSVLISVFIPDSITSVNFSDTIRFLLDQIYPHGVNNDHPYKILVPVNWLDNIETRTITLILFRMFNPRGIPIYIYEDNPATEKLTIRQIEYITENDSQLCEPIHHPSSIE
jgi:hypothetical protein